MKRGKCQFHANYPLFLNKYCLYTALNSQKANKDYKRFNKPVFPNTNQDWMGVKPMTALLDVIKLMQFITILFVSFFL